MDRTGGDRDGQRLTAFARRLHLLVLHLSGTTIRARVEVEDIVQEVFLRALSTPGGLPDPGPAGEDGRLWGLLVTIARNTVVDVARALRAARRAGRAGSLARSDWTRIGAAEPTARTPGPVTRVSSRETQAALERAFDQLSADHRRVIGLRQFEGLSAAETGRRMGRSESAVHSLYRRALEAWEEALPSALQDGT